MKYSEKVISAFLLNTKNADIAKAAGISVRSVVRYKSDPEFKKALETRKAELVRTSISAMQTALTGAVGVLVSVMRDRGNNPQVRVYAANTLLSQCRAYTELGDIERRVSALEEEADPLSKAFEWFERNGDESLL